MPGPFAPPLHSLDPPFSDLILLGADALPLSSAELICDPVVLLLLLPDLLLQVGHVALEVCILLLER